MNIAILYREQGLIKHTFLWFLRAASLNNGDAEVELARLLIDGKRVRKSKADARRHLKKALSSKNITPAGIEEAQRLIAGL